MDNPLTTYNLCGGHVTLEYLEAIMECLNKYGEIKIVNVGKPNSLLLLGAELMAYYVKAIKE